MNILIFIKNLSYLHQLSGIQFYKWDLKLVLLAYITIFLVYNKICLFFEFFYQTFVLTNFKLLKYRLINPNGFRFVFFLFLKFGQVIMVRVLMLSF